MRKYHVYGIGNALVDSDVQVDEAFLQAQQVEKSVMTLTDEETHQRLLNAISSYNCHSGCGGSAANTMIALSQFGGHGYYSCKVADDEAGRLFLRELRALKLDCNLSFETLSPGVTGQCLVLVTEDAQRSMNTHLGISETLGPDVLDLEAIADSEYVYLEGYLVTSPTARKALLAARRHAKESKTKVAMTLSDINMVRYFKVELLTIIDGKVDLLFCNEEEALLFTGAEYLEKAIALLQPFANHLVVTCGSQGAVLAIDGEVIAIPTKAIQAIDTVGAGDMFAGAYLYAITHGYAPQQAVELANKAAAEVVSQYGARLSEQKVVSVREAFIASNYSFAKRTYNKAAKAAELEVVE
ncbi:Ribokinase [Legionella massiliensis]|uniref:Ribokinase n=1 Tax=Legionella massiliensis TaxID=1034943 RepID=A0A078KZ18_9GAMM|nr:adenosine kinase [Legionella massiliensis]CDZ78302.1 Ribokinase [Legionella massiliensis]CEE14040.1 2-dehydro-3-deoxygluconokinase [Legionella massiliensis]